MADCQIRCRIKGIDYIGHLDLNNLKKSGSFKWIRKKGSNLTYGSRTKY